MQSRSRFTTRWISAAVLAIALLASTIGIALATTQNAPESQAGLTTYMIGRWHSVEVAENVYGWEPEYPVDIAIDLRSIGQQSVIPTRLGATQCCLLSMNQSPLLEVNDAWLLLGFAPDQNLQTPATTLEGRLGLFPGTINSFTVGRFIFEILVEESAPSLGRKPLFPNKNRVWEMGFNGTRLFNISTEQSPEGWAKVVEQLQLNYDAARQESLKTEDDSYLRYLEWLSRKYKESYTTFLGDNPDEGTVKPRTTATEDWDCSDDAAISCDLTWVEHVDGSEILSNELTNSGTGARFQGRAESDLSADDMEVSLDLTEMSNPSTASKTSNVGPAARYSSSTTNQATTNLYAFVCEDDGLGARHWILRKIVNGSITNLESGGAASCALTDNMAVRADGSTITGWINSSQVTANNSDSAITGHLRGGFAGFINSSWSGNTVSIDNWQATDAFGGGAARRRLIN